MNAAPQTADPAAIQKSFEALLAGPKPTEDDAPLPGPRAPKRRKPREYPGSKGKTWQEWKEDTWWLMAYNFRAYPGLAPLEQYARRSEEQQRCVECGEPGTVRVPTDRHSLIKVVSCYWFCQAHSDYWTEKGERDRADALAGLLEDGIGDGYPQPTPPVAGVAI